MALHGCLPWWSGWRTARPRQWGYGEYASCAGFVPAPGAVRPERWRGVRCGAMGSGEGAMAKRAGGAVAVARGQGGLDRKSTRLELQSLMRISYAVFCLKKKTRKNKK